MVTQKNLMIFQIIISVVYGIWVILAPGSIMKTYGAPEEFVNPVTFNTVMLFGVSAFVRPETIQIALSQKILEPEIGWMQKSKT